MSMSKTPVEPPLKTQKLDGIEGPNPTLVAVRTIEDLPTHVLSKILEFLTKNFNRNKMLGLRLVNSEWKSVLDSLLEKKLVSGKFRPFPAFQILGTLPYNMLLRCPPKTFAAGLNPFPCNSLVLNGLLKSSEFNYLDETPQDKYMELPVFIPKFGSQLTTFAIQNVVIKINNLVKMLGSMPFLKLLNVKNVKLDAEIVKPDASLPAAPDLPSLSTLEIRSSKTDVKDDKENMLYIYLIASYADQIVNLILGTNEPLPALQKGHRYYHPLPRLKTFSIATTSDAAFGKLKQLKLYRPGTPFLRFSETPSLKNLVVIREGDDTRVYLEDLAIFIGNCGSGLKMVHLDLIWSEMMGRVNAREFPEGKKVVPSLEGVVVSSLKTLSVAYPNTDAYERILSKEFILLFPSLQKLHFLYYKPSEYDWIPPLAQLNRNVNGAVEGNKEKFGDEIGALKASLDPLWRRMVVINGNLWEANVKAKIQQHKFVQKVRDFPAQMRQRAEIKELQGSMVAVRNERAGIIRRLAALGEKREKVIVEQLLERGGYWVTCPNLKVVSASSAGIVKGNVLVDHRSIHNILV